jgi:hypothetical protein
MINPIIVDLAAIDLFLMWDRLFSRDHRGPN